MKKKLQLSIVNSGSGEQTTAAEKEIRALIPTWIEGSGAVVTGNSAKELNQTDGLICIITDGTFEEVRKSLNYALDKEKPVAYYLDDSVTLDGGMQLQLGLATNLGTVSEAEDRLKDWLRQLEDIQRKCLRKRIILFSAAGILLLSLLLSLAILKPGRNSIPAEKEVFEEDGETASEARGEGQNQAVPEAIHIEDAETLKTLDLSGRSITDIRFLQDCVNLEELNLANNGITDISALAKLSKLKKLDISNNRITDINILLALPELSEVNVSGNPIEDDTAMEYMKDINWKK